jgi:hypothetical protein
MRVHKRLCGRHQHDVFGRDVGANLRCCGNDITDNDPKQSQ